MIRPALAFLLLAGAASAHPAMTVYDTTMRAAPSGHARVVQRIPAHAEIDVGDCGDVWCPAAWRDIDGFVRVDAVGPRDAPALGAGADRGPVTSPVRPGPAVPRAGGSPARSRYRRSDRPPP